MKHFKILRDAEMLALKVLEKVQEYENLNKSDLAAKTNEFKKMLSEGKTLDDILIDAFATAYRMIQEVYGISLYKVQVMGGIVIHTGDVAEMKTGEGKTLAAVMPAYLNALSEKPVYVLTVNEYLSTRDGDETSKIYLPLGISVGVVTSEQNSSTKKMNYAKDIVYLVNSELGFDYLRDNMVFDMKEKSQRELSFAIIDECDSILIDEAKTPLIISGGQLASSNEYLMANRFVTSLTKEDYDIDNETKTASLLIPGVKKAEDFFKTKNLYNFKNSILLRRIKNALQANKIFKKDVDYTIIDDEIVLIDIFTGRLLPGRTYSEGLNQALEAKENVKINPESRVMATITFQNLFRLFKKVSGMTGTAETDEEEFLNIYNMRVIAIPSHKPILRIDYTDYLFKTKQQKNNAIVQKIIELNKTKQPILVGTRTVSDSEEISNLLIAQGIKHELLNAKNNTREAEIIKMAGQLGRITISTNMAGRGTDISLGEGVVELGGLFVIGVERNDSRRIDNQLIGRAGRQGDPGESQFFICTEDELFLKSGLDKLGKNMDDDSNDYIESSQITKAVATSQKRIEGNNFDQRKTLVEYEEVLNRQREIVYSERDFILLSEQMKDTGNKTLLSYLERKVTDSDAWDRETFDSIKYIKLINTELFNNEVIAPEKIRDQKEAMMYVYQTLINNFNNSIEAISDDEINVSLMKSSLQSIDYFWQMHLEKMAKLRQNIKFIQYEQKNPLQYYILEANKLFLEFQHIVQDSFARSFVNVPGMINRMRREVSSPISIEDTSSIKDFNL